MRPPAARGEELSPPAAGPRAAIARLQAALPWAVILLIAIINIKVMYTRIELGDEGVVCMGALRIQQGQVPYRDFFEFITPGTFYALAFFYKALGATFETGRVFALLVALCLVGLYYLIGKRLKLRPLYMAMGLSFCLYGGFEHWSIPSHHWLANLFMAGSVLLLLKLAEGGGIAGAALAGAFAGLTGMTLQDQGGVWFIAASLLVFPFLPGGRRRLLFACWASGCLAVAAIFALMLLPKVGLAEIWFDWIIFPLTRYRGSEINESTLSAASIPIVGYWISGGWREKPFFSVIFTACDIWSMLLMPLSCIALLRELKRRAEGRYIVAILLASCATMVFMVLRRFQLMNIYWSLAIVSVAAAWFLQVVETGSASIVRRRLARWTAACVVGVSITFGLLYISMLEKVKEVRVVTPAGTIAGRWWQAEEAFALGELVSVVAENIGSKEPMFCYGYIPMVNFLTGHPNPTRYSVLLRPGYTTDAQVQEIITDLEKKRVKWLISSGEFPPGDPFDLYVRANYRPIWKNSRFLLILRNGIAPPKSLQK